MNSSLHGAQGLERRGLEENALSRAEKIEVSFVRGYALHAVTRCKRSEHPVEGHTPPYYYCTY